MIQDIYPSKFNNSFSSRSINDNDNLLYFDSDGKLLAAIENNSLRFITGKKSDNAVYLFSVDNEHYLLSETVPAVSAENGYTFRSLKELRGICREKELFIAYTAFHLWKWYADNRYCGRCKGTLEPHKKERALVCPNCNNVIYPRINPAIIVGIIKDDSLLITRYRQGYAHNALVAGFTEIGETFEQTVEREVMEEVGLKVRNIRYYKSQPWGIAQDILVGFFCEADGDAEITMDENELKYAEWVKREEIVLQPDNISLTNEMMSVFKAYEERESIWRII